MTLKLEPAIGGAFRFHIEHGGVLDVFFRRDQKDFCDEVNELVQLDDTRQHWSFLFGMGNAPLGHLLCTFVLFGLGVSGNLGC